MKPQRNPAVPPAQYGGLRPMYHGSDTCCPGCHRSNWLVGRQSAECAVCTVALPLKPERRAA